MGHNLMFLLIGISIMNAFFAAALFYAATLFFGKQKASCKKFAAIFLVSYLSLGITQLAVSYFYPDAAFSFLFSIVAFLIAVVWSKKILEISIWRWALISLFAITLQVVLSTAVRTIVYEPVIAGNDKFAPEIEKGDFVFVCKICREYPENKYVLVWNAASTSYSIFKIVSTVNNGVATVSDGNMSFEVSVDDIHGRVLK